MRIFGAAPFPGDKLADTTGRPAKELDDLIKRCIVAVFVEWVFAGQEILERGVHLLVPGPIQAFAGIRGGKQHLLPLVIA